MDRSPNIPLEGGRRLSSIEGHMQFESVSFTYPSRPGNRVLKEISFELRPGRVVALVGQSGGGKTSIVSLIERFYDPDEGRILLDGVDIKELDPAWYRRKIGFVSQEPVLFASSIRDNITFGVDGPVSNDEVIAAARAANAHDFIMQFAEGYSTMVGERGVRLSGGQKQRVAIARALVLNPRLSIRFALCFALTCLQASCCSTRPHRHSTQKASATCRMRLTMR
jgi:ABC-type multidrug transport system fused ATPase/permease subunit